MVIFYSELIPQEDRFELLIDFSFAFLSTTFHTQYVLSVLQTNTEIEMQTAHDMTPQQISDQLLTALQQMQAEGKVLSNDWDVSTISLPQIKGGSYHHGYGHGGPETFFNTAMRMSESGSPDNNLPALKNIIEGIEQTLVRSEFVQDPKLFVCETYFRSELRFLKWKLNGQY
jgi:hypothetical protein